MFGRNGNDGSNDAPPPQNAPTQAPAVPAFRTFHVTRLKPGGNGQMEVVEILAHGVDYNGPLVFQSLYLNDAGQRLVKAVMAFTNQGEGQWIDFVEIETPVSPVIMH